MKIFTVLIGISLAITACSGQERDDAEFEFGRKRVSSTASGNLPDISESIRELLEEDDFAYSMSMSMSMTAPTPTSPTPAPAPTPVPVPCGDGEVSIETFALEVETANGTETFSEEVALAMAAALAGEYEFCDYQFRRLRRLQFEEIVIGDVTVTAEDEECEIQSADADKCQYARLDIVTIGGSEIFDDAIESSVNDILDDDAEFDNALLEDGIVDVRIRTMTDSVPRTVLETKDEPEGGSSATAAVISAAAAGLIVLAVLAVRRKRPQEAYVKVDASNEPPEEIETDNHSHTFGSSMGDAI